MTDTGRLQFLIEAKCSHGERGHVSVYTEAIADSVDCHRVVEVFTSTEQSSNVAIEKRSNRTLVKIRFAHGQTLNGFTGRFVPNEYIAGGEAVRQLLDLLSA